MSKGNVLFVVEGDKTEPKVLSAAHQILYGAKPENIFSYHTAVHKLAESMFPEGVVDDNLDLLAVLREQDDGKHSDILMKDYAEVFLVFDMDPQDPRYDPKLLRVALDYFNESTENGKLYINYPMVESYKHITSEKFDDFKELRVDMEMIRRYKSLVNDKGLERFKHLSKYDFDTLKIQISFNLRKFNYLMSGDDSIPDVESYSELDLKSLFDTQVEILDDQGLLHVLNTFMISLIDRNPAKYIEMIR